MYCLNTVCKKALNDREAEVYLKVMLCKQCASRTRKLRDRARSQIEVLLATLDDTLQYSLLSDEEFSEEDTLLEYIVRVQKKCRSTSKTTTSSKSMKPSASSADGSGSSHKPSVPA